MTETFEYRVRDAQGRVVGGTLEGDDVDAVARKLRDMGMVPIVVRRRGLGLRTEIVLRPGHVELKDLAIFCRQFATMLNAGLPILRCLAALTEQTTSREFGKILRILRADVEQGMSLTDALARHPKAFDGLFVAMARTGEATGLLGDVMAELASQIEREVTLRGRVRSAMTYPIAVLGLVVVILAGMLLFVVPQFERIYGQLGASLPFPTLVLVGAASVVQRLWWLVAIAMFAGIYYLRRWLVTPAGRARFDRLKLDVPILGELFRKVAMARFSNTLATMLKAGVGILPALDVVRGTVNNVVVAEAIDRVRERVREGSAVSGPLSQEAVFPPMVTQMLAVGEDAGAIDTMLEKVATFYNEEVTAAVDGLTSVIEPILIVVIGVIVGASVVALYLPMFNIINLIQ